MKYRLNIKYPITEYRSGDFCNVYNLSGKWFEIISDQPNRRGLVEIKDELGDVYRCPLGWLEEIKEESFFDKWIEGIIPPREHDYKQLVDCWKASEKNTHKLYSELINHFQTIFDKVMSESFDAIDFGNFIIAYNSELRKIEHAQE